MELKEKLAALRKKKGLSQAELAEAIKVSRQTISRWEVGTAVPSADNLMWLSKFYFYEVSLDELMNIAVDSEQFISVEQQVTSPKTVFQKKIAIVLCVIAVFINAIIWIVFSFSKNPDNNDIPVSIGELNSYDVGSMNQEYAEFDEFGKW